MPRGYEYWIELDAGDASTEIGDHMGRAGGFWAAGADRLRELQSDASMD
jgi:hypothetical protein